MNAPLESPAANLSAQEPVDPPLVVRSMVRPGLVRLTLNRPASFNALSEHARGLPVHDHGAAGPVRSDRQRPIGSGGYSGCSGQSLLCRA